MKTIVKLSLVITAILCLWPVSSIAEPKTPFSALEAACLAEACQITALMNEGKWDDVEKILGTKEGAIATLRKDATIKDWPGIGAYRGASFGQGDTRSVMFRFGFSPRQNPHEINIIYVITASGPSKPNLTIFGW